MLDFVGKVGKSRIRFINICLRQKDYEPKKFIIIKVIKFRTQMMMNNG